MFEPEIGEDHMKLLLDHVDAFFTDIIVETKDRETTIQDRIESKFSIILHARKILIFQSTDLRKERQNLKRLLKEDANEVNTSNVPLYTLQNNIDESLKDLRKKLQSRRDEIQSLLAEQEGVCEGESLENVKGAVS